MNRQRTFDAAMALQQLLASRCSNLFALVSGRRRELVWADWNVRVWRDRYLARVRWVDTVEGETYIAFGQGSTAWEAIVVLDRALAAGRWSVDRPYRPKPDDGDGSGRVSRSRSAYVDALRRAELTHGCGATPTSYFDRSDGASSQEARGSDE